MQFSTPVVSLLGHLCELKEFIYPLKTTKTPGGEVSSTFFDILSSANCIMYILIVASVT